MTSDEGIQMELAAWAEAVQEERERAAEVNERRVRGFLVFATDPERAPDELGCRDVYATEARTPGEAAAKIRPLAEARRLRTLPCFRDLQGRARRGPLGRADRAERVPGELCARVLQRCREIG
jgi:hypothetical protein